MSTVSITLDVTQEVYDRIENLANQLGMTVQQLSCVFLEDGSSLLLSPEEIRDAINTEKERLLRAAHSIPTSPEN